MRVIQKGKTLLAFKTSKCNVQVLLFIFRSYNLSEPEVTLTNPNLELERFQKSDDHIGE